MKKTLAPFVAAFLSCSLAIGLFALCTRAFHAPPGMIKVAAIVAFTVAGSVTLLATGISESKHK